MVADNNDPPTPHELMDRVRNSSIAGHTSGAPILIAFESYEDDVTPNGMYVVRYSYTGGTYCSTLDDFPLRMDKPETPGLHRHISIAMRRTVDNIWGPDNTRMFFGSWVATPTEQENAKSRLVQFPTPRPALFETFDAAAFGPIEIPEGDTRDITASSAISRVLDSEEQIVLKWEADTANDLRDVSKRGLLRVFDSSFTDPDLVRCCGGSSGTCAAESCAAQFATWAPCLRRRDDSIQAVIWSEKETPGLASAFFNIALRIYKPDNETIIDRFDRDSGVPERRSVNEPLRDRQPSDQTSPCIDIDPCGNMCAVWVGPVARSKIDPSQPCTLDDDLAVYARRFYFTGQKLLALSGQFRVDTSGSEWSLGSVPEAVHPSVALVQSRKLAGNQTLDEQLVGRMFIAWNAIHRVSGQKSVRGQFYHWDGRPLGPEIDVSPYLTQGENPEPDGIDRTLAESNQHTTAFLDDEKLSAYATWTAHESNGNNNVWWTRFTIHFMAALADLETNPTLNCLRGDCDVDGTLDLGDVPPFVEYLLSENQPIGCNSYSNLEYCRADANGDGVVDGRDVQCFTNLHTSSTGPCRTTAFFDCSQPGTPPGGMRDCDGNEVDDSIDLAFGSALDCNRNGIPDTCDLDESDPDENGQVSYDRNEDGVPDECQPDCDRDGYVDDFAIAQEMVADVDENGVPDICQTDCDFNDLPDEFEIANGAADCNENGVLDICEYDCNENGVPDDCDVNRSDPDGNSEVSEDCNENGVPDECDLSRAMLPSFDCNDNNIPDECELSGNDSNENGILDECEKESHGGNQAMMPGGEGGGEFDEAAAWELFFEWYEEQVSGTPGDWGTLSGPERFERVMDELDLLGLPYAAPW